MKIQLSFCIIKFHAVKKYGWSGYPYLQVQEDQEDSNCTFLTLAVDGDGSSTLNLGKESLVPFQCSGWCGGQHFIEYCVWYWT
jgi:hypothetical protein